MTIIKIEPVQKAKVRIHFADGVVLLLYKREADKLGLDEQMEISDELYWHIYYEIVGKRAKKRALHLLEKMDRTEEQLRRKLAEGQYPTELVEEAIAYAKSYRYIDDERYARNFILCNQEKKSRGRMRMDLLSKGVAEEIIERAMEEENHSSQEELICRLLQKKAYHADTASLQETKKMYRFLLCRGFQSEEIMHVLKNARISYTSE